MWLSRRTERRISRYCFGTATPKREIANGSGSSSFSAACRHYRRRDLERVTVDTTVQPMAITFPTDAKLLHAAIERSARLASRTGFRPSSSWVHNQTSECLVGDAVLIATCLRKNCLANREFYREFHNFRASGRSIEARSRCAAATSRAIPCSN